MKYKSPKQHNNVVQTMLEEAIKQIIKTKHYASTDVNMLTNVLDYHQQINDKEIKRRFYEDFTEMQQELPVIHVDSDLLSIIAKHVTQYGFALTHGPDGAYMSTALLHKAGYKVSTKLKTGLNAKRTNVINMLSLAIQDENLTEIEETPDLATQFINAIGYATKHGETKDYKFGTLQYTLEQAYENMIRRQDEGSDECDACIKAYRDAFIIK